MKLDINEVYHNYITKVIIFALFTFKRQSRQPAIYRQSVLSFVNKRIAWKIKLDVTIDKRYKLEDERDILLNDILYDIESNILPIVIITFISPLKDTTMVIDLKDEEKYEKFLYN
jgi:hypothetical protein